MENKYDIIIVGAGPAGSTAAMKMSEQGNRVLLIDKSTFPRDKSCGDGLTRTSTKLLHELGILHHFSEFRKIRGVDVFVEDEGFRQFKYPQSLSDPNYGLVVPRINLDQLLFERAIANGTTFMGKTLFASLVYDEKKERVIGVRTSTGEHYYADLVIGADGAASKIAYQASLATTPKDKLGFGLRGYYTHVPDAGNNLEIYLPILDSSNKHVLPSYGWVFPVSDHEVNIGVGLLEKKGDDNIRLVMDMFIDKLKATNPKYKDIELVGKQLGAPMRFDFTPDKTYAPGLLLVGDAAGMISPFTGEGIGYAIETGIIASQLVEKIKHTSARNFSDLSEYGAILASKYQGYFETGTTSVNRYHLVWKVLKGTFQNDKPLFSAIRQATIFPEGIGESIFDYYTENVSELIIENTGALRADLVTISQHIINSTRDDWPFLSRLFSASQVTPGLPFRPSLFLLLSGYYTLNPDRDTLITLGTALELGFAASVCHESVMEDRIKGTDGTVNWGNMIAILVGDFLLSKSFETISSLKQNYTKVISEALGVSNKGLFLLKNEIETNIENLTIEKYLELSYQKNEYAFELCFYIGAIAGQVPISEINALRSFGKYFGSAYFIMEDVLSNQRNKTCSEFKETNLLYIRNEALSLVQVLKNITDSNTQNDIVGCQDIAFSEMNKAKAALKKIGNKQLRQTLENLCDYILNRSLIMT